MRAVTLLALFSGCVPNCDFHFELPPLFPGNDSVDEQPPFGALDLGPTVMQAIPPPAISGGTLAVLASGTIAVAADPDRDRIYVVDLTTKQKLADLALSPHDEPGRVLEDGHGRVHVVLRSGGAVVTLDPVTWTIASRRDVCPAPRGIAWETATDTIDVACAGGELVSLPASGGAATRTLQLDRDLRDVVAVGGKLVVSRFRSAELLVVDATGTVMSRASLPTVTPTETNHPGMPFAADGAWRIRVSPEGDSIFVLHQRAMGGMVTASSHGGYGGVDSCSDPIVQTALTAWSIDGGASTGAVIANAVVPVDFAFAHHGGQIAVVSAGNAKQRDLPSIVIIDRDAIQNKICSGIGQFTSAGDEPIAVDYTPDDQLIVQSREPALLEFPDTGERVVLSTDSRADTGHAIFHANSGATIACASCHLEGADDGRAWSFDLEVGLRRTQSLRGGILGTEPFHWDGDQPDFEHLVNEVFTKRMAGPVLTTSQMAAAKSWIDSVPVVPPSPGDAAAIARGKALFEDVTGAGCITCHNGPKLTNNLTINVGTGAMFQVPRLLGVSQHPPFLHDGRAATLADRFGTSGGGDMHGHTSQLAPAEIADLAAYLESI